MNRFRIFWPFLVIFVALLILWFESKSRPSASTHANSGVQTETEEKQGEGDKRITLIPVFDARCSIWISPPKNWTGNVLGPDHESGVIATFFTEGQSLILLIQDAGEWDVEHATEMHRDGLLASESATWCGKPEPIKDDPHQGLRFAYSGYARAKTREEDKIYSEERYRVIYVVDTRVIGGKIFRVHSAITGSVPTEGPNTKSKDLINQAEKMLDRVRFEDIDSMGPIKEAVPKGNLIDI